MSALNKRATAWLFAAAIGLAWPAAAQTGTMGGQTGGQIGGTPTEGQTGSQPGMGDDTRIGGHSNGREELHKFIQKAAMSNLAEIQLGQLAQQKAQDPDVKQFAQMMVDGHTKAQAQLQQAASSSTVALPTTLDEKHQHIQSKLAKLNGAEFDREYMKAMVDAHQDAQKLLQTRANSSGRETAATSGTTGGMPGTTGTTGAPGTSGTDVGTSSIASGMAAAVDGWAATTLPEVQQHLQQAKDLEKRVKNSGKDKDKNKDK